MVPPLRGARAVTFDCWGTLIFEADPRAGAQQRLQSLARQLRAAGHTPDAGRLGSALEAAWQRHVALWQAGAASGAPEIAAWALEALDLRDAAAAQTLAGEFAEASLASEILPLPGARDTLERLAAAGVRRALICDTGLSPGRVVRTLLERAELLDLLEVLIFSDEAGVPKPHPRVFEAALNGLGAEPGSAVHVGDLRRTDVAGARAAGMRSVRIRGHHDDRSDLPEADVVVDSHAELCERLALG